MKIKVGCDIVKKDRFLELTKQAGVLDKIFTKHELSQAKGIENLAGVFSAKEAVLKALGLKAGDWHLIEILKQESGKPVVKLSGFSRYNIASHDISISHDGDYAFAVACFVILESTC